MLAVIVSAPAPPVSTLPIAVEVSAWPDGATGSTVISAASLGEVGAASALLAPPPKTEALVSPAGATLSRSTRAAALPRPAPSASTITLVPPAPSETKLT